MRLLLLGNGRMGTQVAALAHAYDCQVVRTLDADSADRAFDAGDLAGAEIAIDFTRPNAVPRNLPRLAAHGIDTVIGTTGWSASEDALRALVAESDVGVLVSPNFSLGLNLFQAIVDEAARRFAERPEYGAWIHESHHAAKRDAPSGTAIQLQAGMRRAGYEAAIDVSSTRAGSCPGTHRVGFDGPSDTITLVHEVRDRAAFARGALEAARWLRGRRGWFTLRDMLAEDRSGDAARHP